MADCGFWHKLYGSLDPTTQNKFLIFSTAMQFEFSIFLLISKQTCWKEMTISCFCLQMSTVNIYYLQIFWFRSPLLKSTNLWSCVDDTFNFEWIWDKFIYYFLFMSCKWWKLINFWRSCESLLKLMDNLWWSDNIEKANKVAEINVSSLHNCWTLEILF